MPAHTDKQTTIVAKVGRPVLLRLRHQGGQVLLDGSIVERLEGLAVVEVGAERVIGRVVLAKDVELDSVGEPVGVLGARAGMVHDGALVGSHFLSRVVVFRRRRYFSLVGDGDFEVRGHWDQGRRGRGEEERTEEVAAVCF